MVGLLIAKFCLKNYDGSNVLTTIQKGKSSSNLLVNCSLMTQQKLNFHRLLGGNSSKCKMGPNCQIKRLIALVKLPRLPDSMRSKRNNFALIIVNQKLHLREFVCMIIFQFICCSIQIIPFQMCVALFRFNDFALLIRCDRLGFNSYRS